MDAHFLGVGSAFAQKLCGKAAFFVEQSQEQMLGADMFAGQSFSFVCRVLQNTPGGFAERQIDVRGDRWALWRMIINSLADVLKICFRQPTVQGFVLAN